MRAKKDVTQGSADPPEHLREKPFPREQNRGSPNADAWVERAGPPKLELARREPEE